MSVSQTDEQQLLRAAQEGDEDAFRTLVAERRPELHAHCYRMLASFHDAEDAVQEAIIRAWRGLPRFESRSSVRTWLYKITTNAALDIASGRARRELPVEFCAPAGRGDPTGDPDTDIAWMEPYPARDGEAVPGLPESSYMARETIELVYVAALQYLPANQRAAFILHEVLGFRSTETAELLDTTVAAVNSSLQRARVQLHDRIPKVSQRRELRFLGDAGAKELAHRYACAIEEGDLDTLLSLLTGCPRRTRRPRAEMRAHRRSDGVSHDRGSHPSGTEELSDGAGPVCDIRTSRAASCRLTDAEISRQSAAFACPRRVVKARSERAMLPLRNQLISDLVRGRRNELSRLATGASPRGWQIVTSSRSDLGSRSSRARARLFGSAVALAHHAEVEIGDGAP